MIKRYKKNQEQKKFYRVNDKIFAKELRVLDQEGKQIGIMNRSEALSKARELGLDIVEIAAQAVPPVARIIDFKKFLYQEEKKKKEEKKKARISETKEIRLGPFMSDNDLQVMIRRADEFITDGDKVRLVVKFRGRAITRQEFGYDIVGKVVDSLASKAKVDREPHLEGKQLIALISPERKKSNGKSETENTQISSKTLQSNEDGEGRV